ncbi:MAG TPA: hypothetical protein VK791_01580 [bacterium]|nr:hypothetical protein [bacterium]
MTPMLEYRDLAAGNGENGFKDGPFYSAEFNQPMGLVFNPDASILYVADQKNNSIREVLFTENNKVVTLAGSINPGCQDGPLASASFNQPKDLTFLPDNRMVLYDQGNQLIRLIDLTGNTVGTLAGGGKKGQTEGEALKVQLGAIWNLAYYAKDQCLYFSLPDDGLLQRLDLKSGKIATILKNNALIPHPKAICVAGGKFYIADRDITFLYEIQPPAREAKPALLTAYNLNPVLKNIAQASASILCLTGTEKTLYGYQANLSHPVYSFPPGMGEVNYASGFGYMLPTIPQPEYYSVHPPGQLIPAFQTMTGWGQEDQPMTSWGQVGFVCDPRCADRLYVTNPVHSFIAAIRDYSVCATPDETTDLKSVYAKPPRTFRLFICGRSIIENQVDNREYSAPLEARHQEIQDRLSSVPERLERELNTQGALDDSPTHFEVFRKTLKYYNLLIESYWYVPQICAKYDLDQVVIMRDDKELSRMINTLPGRPLDSDGLPVTQTVDSFAQKPMKDRFPTGPYHDFIQYIGANAASKNLANCVSDLYWIFNPDYILKDPRGRKLLMDVVALPLKMMKKKMDRMKTTDGHTPQLVLCYFPLGSTFFTWEPERLFWKDLCQQEGIAFLDLSDDYAAIGMTYHPYNVLADGHWTGNGMELFTRLLARELAKNKLIPVKQTVESKE